MAQSSSSCSPRSSCPPWLRARPALKKKRGSCVERLDWHIDTRKELKAGCLLAQGSEDSFSYLLSLSSSDSDLLPLSFPNEDSSPEPILSESQPRSTPSIVVHTQRKTLEKIDKKVWVTSFRAAITQKLQMATHGFLSMVGRCFWLRNSWTRSQRNQTTDFFFCQ